MFSMTIDVSYSTPDARVACLDILSLSLAAYINDSRRSKAAAWRLFDVSIAGAKSLCE
jgi:hypothetical protein